MVVFAQTPFIFVRLRLFPLPGACTGLATSCLARGPDRVGALPDVVPHVIVAWVRLLVDGLFGLWASWSLEVSCLGWAAEDVSFLPTVRIHESKA